jgi:predicted nucleotidyltransferase
LDLAGLGNYLEDTLHQKVDILSQRAMRDEIKDAIYKDLVIV